jgi:hypothetical protein
MNSPSTTAISVTPIAAHPVSMPDAEGHEPGHDEHRGDAPVRHAARRDFDNALAALAPTVLIKVAVENRAMTIRAEHGSPPLSGRHGLTGGIQSFERPTHDKWMRGQK